MQRSRSSRICATGIDAISKWQTTSSLELAAVASMATIVPSFALTAEAFAVCLLITSSPRSSMIISTVSTMKG